MHQFSTNWIQSLTSNSPTERSAPLPPPQQPRAVQVQLGLVDGEGSPHIAIQSYSMLQYSYVDYQQKNGEIGVIIHLAIVWGPQLKD